MFQEKKINGASILITGGGGFIATNLAKALSAKGLAKQQIVLADRTFPFMKTSQQLGKVTPCELSELQEVFNLFASQRFTHIFHLAANSDIQKSATEPSVEVRDTFQTTLNIIEAMRTFCEADTKLIFSSSSAVYGNQSTKIDGTTSPHPVSPYGWMKLASEIAVKTLPAENCLYKYIFRFPNVVGEFATHGVVFDLVQKYKSQDQDLNVLGNGNQTKPYIHASQLADIIVELSLREPNQELTEINISPDDQISVKEIAHTISAAFGESKKVIFGDTDFGWVGDVPNYSFETEALKKIYKPEIFSSKKAIVLAINDQISANGR